MNAALAAGPFEIELPHRLFKLPDFRGVRIEKPDRQMVRLRSPQEPVLHDDPPLTRGALMEYRVAQDTVEKSASAR